LEQQQNVVVLLLNFKVESGNILCVLDAVEPWTWGDRVDDHLKRHFFPKACIDHVIEFSVFSYCHTPLKPGVIPDIDRAEQQKSAETIVSLTSRNSISFDRNALSCSSEPYFINDDGYEQA